MIRHDYDITSSLRRGALHQLMEYHLLDKRLIDLMMMVLVRQTEEYDMMLHMENTDILMLVAEIEVGDMTADDVDKLACTADVVKPRREVDQQSDSFCDSTTIYASSDSSSDELIKFLAGKDLQWQFPKHTQAAEQKPLDVPIKSQEEDPLPLDIDFPYPAITSSSTCNKPVLGLRAPKAEDGCCGSRRKRIF
uniref:Uncharacterized protein n=1 Tax=Tanacetum cinerariifolium TaxID=118510 RepID=A0A699ISN1_TANCI|nr:hypothetical protein [Tanacetum cinerariifolium]